MTYIYHNVKLLRVIDGDTVELEVDAGFRLTYRDSFRLARINAPERNKPGGSEAKAHLEKLLNNGISRLQTARRDKYGRWLAEVYFLVDSGEMNASDAMRMDGHAILYV